MAKELRKLSVPKDGRGIRCLVFFVLFYLYMWLVVDLRLIYHGGGEIANFPVFYMGQQFFGRLIVWPGGLLQYVGAFWGQFFYYSWAGAVVITVQGWLFCKCTDTILKAANASAIGIIRFVPAILLIIIYNQYTFHFLTTLALLTAMLFVCLYLKIASRNSRFRIAAFLVLCVISYLVSAAACLPFAVMCIAYELLFKRDWRSVFICSVSAVLIPYVIGVLLFGVSVIDAYTKFLPFSWETVNFTMRRKAVTVVYVLYVLEVSVVFAAWVWQAIVTRSRSGKKKAGSVAGLLVTSAVVFAAATAAALFSVDAERKTTIAVDYYSHVGQWEKVLKIGSKFQNNYPVIHAIDRALYHSGRLGDEMFRYLQHPDALMMTGPGNKNAFWKSIDMYIDLGNMNVAERKLTESLEIYGERPSLLRRLALVNMAKGDIGSARIYLGALSKTLFEGGWAREYLEKIEANPKLSSDARIQQLRRSMPDNDYGALHFWPDKMLEDLLKKNPKNHMAYEYLMALCMLGGDIDKFVQNLDRMYDFEYDRVPRHWEETILTYQTKMKKSVTMRDKQISRETLSRYQNYIQILRRYGSNKNAAYGELSRGYSDTFIFFFMYGMSGVQE